MIVFNRNLLFVNEPELDDRMTKSSLETILVTETPFCIERHDLMMKTVWFPMSGQEARYHSSTPFHKADTLFSWGLEIKNILTLVWDAKKREIHYSKAEGYAPERLRFWVLHTFLPRVFELERSYRILHVGSVEIENKPILFSAFSFGGKSTLTDYFIQKGHPLLSDDSLGIEKRDNSYYAIPSYPFHRPYRKIETLGYYVENISAEPKPLHAVYALEKVGPDADVSIEELMGIEKFKAFHYSNFIDFVFMKKERFEFFTEMAKHVPVYRINIPWDKARLEEVYQAIISHTL
jgi:hypothetical protein